MMHSYFKAHSPVRRDFNQKSTVKTNNFNEKVNTAKVNNVTTAGPKAIVNATEGNGENIVKSSACWIWRPTGNIIDHTSKDSGSYKLKRFDYDNSQYTVQDQGIFDSGCSGHMTGKKYFLTDYQEIDGGFVAFGGSPKGEPGMRPCLPTYWKMDLETIDKTLFIKRQRQVLDDILKKFDLVTVKAASTPIETNKALLKDEEAKDVDVRLYRSLIRLLMYLTASRPDIMFTVCPLLECLTPEALIEGRLISVKIQWIMLDMRWNGMKQQLKMKADETVIKKWEDKMERAATTASSLEVEQDSGNINRTQSMATLNESFPQGTDSGSGPRVNTLGSGEDNMKLKEMMEFCTKLFVRAFDL
ncbi:hypothetical protein Tco_0102816 [Tanacetum coccineum]